MPSLLPPMSTTERKQFFTDLNYLNTREFRAFCRAHSIPFRISVEEANGVTKGTRDTDRKPIVLHRMRHYLRTGRILDETCLSAKVVGVGDPPKKFKAADRLRYGWYNKNNRSLIHALQELTDGRFKDGAIARVLIMEFWTQGQAPTLARFAKAWTKAVTEYDLLTPEYAYLTDLRKKEAGKHWKGVRAEKAKRVMKILRAIPTH